MAIDLAKLGHSQHGSTTRWDEDDIMLYAVTVGAGADGVSDLEYATENSRVGALQAVPTFPVIVTARSGASPIWEVGNFPLSSVIHAGQRVTLPQAFPVSGAVSSTAQITGIFDTGKHAIIETTTTLTDTESNDLVARTVSTVLVLGEGGFGGPRQPADPWEVPDREPDGVCKFPTTPNQALLYRLNGDRNPLHSDPEQAQQAGFAGTILHGLCTYAVSTREIVSAALGNQASSLESVEARFSGPVAPGDVLETQWWREESSQRILFRTLVSGRVVLDRGVVVIRA